MVGHMVRSVLCELAILRGACWPCSACLVQCPSSSAVCWNPTMRQHLPQLLLVMLAFAVTRGAAEMACDSNAASFSARVKSSGSSSSRHRLLDDILCEYDTNTQPQRIVNVTIELLIRKARVVSRTIETTALMNVQWKDQFLTWDPARYDGTKEIQIKSDDIWVPIVSTVSTLPWTRVGRRQVDPWPATCRVSSDGTVKCSSAIELGGACAVSYLFWPHVAATCYSFVGSDPRTEKNVDIKFHNDSVKEELRDYVPDNDWLITEAERSVLQFPDGSALTYTINLRSQGAVLLTGLLGPGTVVSVLLLSSFLFPATCYVRLGLCCCATFGTVLASSLLFESLPAYDGPNPVIVTFYSGLLVLSAIATVMTLLLTTIVPQTTKPPDAPRWLYSMRSWLIDTATGKICLKVLFMAQQQNYSQAVELMPALHMQTDESAGSSNNGQEDNEQDPPTCDVPDHQEKPNQSNSGQHGIWDFTAVFLNRSMFYIFLLNCNILCLYLVHSMTMYEDLFIDFSD